MTAEMRPASITIFERCYLGAWILGLINTALSWDIAQEILNANPAIAELGPGFVSTMLIGGTAIGAAITLTLWYFVARRGARVAKWIVVILYALGAVSFLRQLMGADTVMRLGFGILFVQFILQTIAVVMLFRPDTKSWFGETSIEPIA